MVFQNLDHPAVNAFLPTRCHSPRLPPVLLGLGDQGGEFHTERACQALRDLQTRVALTALDQTHMGGMNASFLGETLLGQTLCCAITAE
jgi:hypothetical protein